MKYVQLTSGVVCQVDDQDFPWIIKRRWVEWRTGTTTYASRPRLSMHRAIWQRHRRTNPPMLDHEDGDGLNNQIANLRPATNRQNQGNTKLDRRNTSGYRGVCYRAAATTRPWRASISTRIDGKQNCHVLGYFATKEEAARAYDDAAVAKWGEFYKRQVQW